MRVQLSMCRSPPSPSASPAPTGRADGMSVGRCWPSYRTEASLGGSSCPSVPRSTAETPCVPMPRSIHCRFASLLPSPACDTTVVQYSMYCIPYDCVWGPMMAGGLAQIVNRVIVSRHFQYPPSSALKRELERGPQLGTIYRAVSGS